MDLLVSDENFWNDNDKAREVLKTLNEYRQKVEAFESIDELIEDTDLIIEFINSGDDSYQSEFINNIKLLEEELNKHRNEILFNDEYDENSAIVSINSGTGGLDAQDWTEMLLRMYNRWSEKKGFKVKLLDIVKDTEAGIKTVSLFIEGEKAYGYLKGEKGVHRLVRISPFDSSGKRHTSFASVDVMPDIKEIESINIDPKNLKIDTYRASGAGGQHVNKTNSAVRITHIPTGIVVQCQNERSQLYNRQTAMKILIGKLIEIKKQEQQEEIDDIKGNYSEIAWGSQIRSYVFNPYQLVKDHRTDMETGDVNKVLDGELDNFMLAYLKYI